MSKKHQIDIPAGARGWTITSMDKEERSILKDDITELLDEAYALCTISMERQRQTEDTLYSNNENTALSTATMRLCQALQSLVAGLI
jgi:hypothetical protein